ncbi:MAG: hypothetical protein CVV25_02855 [Ignavibacteriae bacterium HGW-Ignavibacteriae-4]|jgi:hypothetical protein|nr:MAG: hypothetical protein CVV25_02855 [Ignavibacteriae bacterium HGW-Ignavibacteriae-4]
MKTLFISIIVLFFGAISLQSQTKDTVYVVTKDTVFVNKKAKFDPINGEIGAALGTPGGINLTGAIHSDKLVVRLSGMLLNTISGIQVDLGFKFSEVKQTYHALSLVAGMSKIEDADLRGYGYSIYNTWDYVGINYNMNSKGFLLGVGLSAGSGSYSSPQLLFQIGYSYQIR